MPHKPFIFPFGGSTCFWNWTCGSDVRGRVFPWSPSNHEFDPSTPLPLLCGSSRWAVGQLRKARDSAIIRWAVECSLWWNVYSIVSVPRPQIGGHSVHVSSLWLFVVFREYVGDMQIKSSKWFYFSAEKNGFTNLCGLIHFMLWEDTFECHHHAFIIRKHRSHPI